MRETVEVRGVVDSGPVAGNSLGGVIVRHYEDNVGFGWASVSCHFGGGCGGYEDPVRVDAVLACRDGRGGVLIETGGCTGSCWRKKEGKWRRDSWSCRGGCPLGASDVVALDCLGKLGPRRLSREWLVSGVTFPALSLFSPSSFLLPSVSMD